MASTSTRTRTTRTSTPTSTPTNTPVATVAAPVGATSTSVAGTPQAQVPHLAYLATLPVPVALVAPTAPWPGWGKAVRVQGQGWSGAVYANRGNLDLRTTPATAAALAKAVPGATVRGPQGQYVRLPFTATGTPQA